MSRPGRGLRRLPLRVRLVAGFAAGMLVVLTGAGGFVYWRVQYALDLRLDEDLAAQSAALARALRTDTDPLAALASLSAAAKDDQVLDEQGRVLAAGSTGAAALLTPAQATTATSRTVHASRGSILSGKGRHLRIEAVPATVDGAPVVAVAAVRLDQRDEALRELLGQLTLANLVALLVASAVGYRLARAALAPVEAYRSRAAEIADGATGVRLDVPDGPDDEVRRLGQTLNDMLTAQERSAERQRQFIDDASHELRTPLTLLAGEVELALRRPRTAAELEDALRRIGTDTARLVALADDLLTLGAQGTNTAARDRILVGPLLDRAAARAQALLPAGSVRTVRAQCPYGLALTGDEALLARALGNLVDNAVRHGDGAILISARRHQCVELGVQDSGPGMPVDFLSRATRRFSKASPSRAGGSGLGLSLVEAISEAHGGQLRICTNGRHHPTHAVSPLLDGLPCRHTATGTTVTLLLPGSAPRDAE